MNKPQHATVRVLDLAAIDTIDASLLTETERAAAARFRFEADRRRFTLGRTTLRRLLNHRGEFTIGTHGKLLLEGAHFNVSHSGDRVLIAIGDAPLGVDVERIDSARGLDEIAHRYFSPPERVWIDAQPDRVRAFFQLWSRKEAVMKADGRGISLGLMDVHIDPDRGVGIVEGMTWQLTEIDAGADYAACLAALPGTVIGVRWR